MKTTVRCFTLALVAGFVWQYGTAGTVLGTEGKKCFPTTWTMTDPGPGNSISVYGDWIENIDRATGPSGVTITILEKFNGSQNTGPTYRSGTYNGKGRVDLRINTNNASPGIKTITLVDDAVLGVGGGTFTFTITVFAAPAVTGVDVPAMNEPFKDITVTLRGTGLKEARSYANGVIVADNATPFVPVGDDASVVSVRLQAPSPTSIQARIFFSELIQDATVELTIRTDTDCCPLSTGLNDADGFKTRVRVRTILGLRKSPILAPVR